MKNHNRVLRYIMIAVLLAAMFGVSASAKKIVATEHVRTETEIAAMHRELSHSGFERRTTSYDQVPGLTSPYKAGSLDKADIGDALNAMKMVRFLAGVPFENIKFTDELNNIAQHGSVLLAASNQFTHSPGKPVDMSEEFYELGKRGCSEANINAGKNNISGAVLSFIYDSGQGNISRVGHRRWILKPGGENFGIGYARGTGSYGGYRINLHVFDGYGAYNCESDSYIAWPAAGAFPLQYFGASDDIDIPVAAPWSINLGVMYSVPKKNDLSIRLTRKSDGKVWVFDNNTPDLGTQSMSDSKLHLAVDNDGYGMGKAIVFRPDMSSLGVIADGETFEVQLSGIRYSDGTDAVLTYEVNFFDLERALEEYDAFMAVNAHTAYIPPFDVTMNGVKIDNKELKYPFILYNNITYFPMTYFDSRFLGVGTNYTPETGLEVFRLEQGPETYKGEMGEKKNPDSFNVSVAAGKITVNGKAIINAAEEYPLLLFRDVTYFPMTWRFCVDEFGWDYGFDKIRGLVINTVG